MSYRSFILVTLLAASCRMTDSQVALKPAASGWAPYFEFTVGPAPVTQISFHPDGRQLLVATGDRGQAFQQGQRLFASSNISLWQIDTGPEQRWKHSYQSRWAVVRFSASGERGLSGTGRGLDWIDTESLQLSAAQPPFGVPANAFARIFSTDGRLVVWEDESTSPSRERQRCWVQDISTEEVVAEVSLDGELEGIAGIDAVQELLLVELSNTPHAKRSRLSVRDLRTQAAIATIQCTGFVFFTELSPDGRLVAVAERIPNTSDDAVAIVSVWDVRSGEKVGTLDMPGSYVWALAFTSDGKLLAVGSERSDLQGGVEILEVATSKRVANWTLNEVWGVTGLAFSPDDKRLAVGTVDGRVRLYERPESTTTTGADRTRVTP